MKYGKPALSYEQQAVLLESRGMLVTDRPAFLRRLEAVGYYRLCAYWHPFKRPDDSFLAGTSFDVIWNRYRFDRQLRLKVMDGIERVEVAVRTSLVHELGIRSGPFAHLDPRNFNPHGSGQHQTFLKKLREEAQRSKERFIQHFQLTYDEYPDLPIWVACETMDFGTVFTLFKISNLKAQRAVAKRFGLPVSALQSWLLTLNYVRNICAHHARLWNRELALKPELLRTDQRWHQPTQIQNDRVFVVLTILQQLLNTTAPQSGWKQRLIHLFDDFPEIPTNQMGMPPEWRQHALWQ